jgi:hypothetical protein
MRSVFVGCLMLLALAGCAMDHMSGEVFIVRPAGTVDTATSVEPEAKASTPETPKHPSVDEARPSNPGAPRTIK